MSKIIFRDSYIIVVPSFDKTAQHKHPFQHLFFSKNGLRIAVDGAEQDGNLLFVDSNVKHGVPPASGCDFFLLIDPTGRLAEALHQKYGHGGSCAEVLAAPEGFPNQPALLPEDEMSRAVDALLASIALPNNPAATEDDVIQQVVSRIIAGEWLSYSVQQIANAVYLSESRLAHRFKQEIGISLKSYTLIRRMELAYRLIHSGSKITHAAQEAGFSSSSHLAYTCKTLTGVSISDVLR